MKKKLLYNKDNINPEKDQNSVVINIENSEVLEVFGINNQNLDFFEKNLPVKIFQKGNQLTIHGSRKNAQILRDAIAQTIDSKKSNKKENYNFNLLQDNLRMQILNNKENIKNINIT